MTVNEIIKIFDCVNEIKDKKLPIKISLILIRNLKKLKEIMEDIEDKRTEIINKYADRDEKGQLILNKKDQFQVSNNITNFENDLKELFNTQIKIQFDKFSIEDIEKYDENKFDSLTMNEVEILQNFIN